MARITPSELVSEISGSIGGQSFRRSRFGIVMEPRKLPNRKLTARQSNVRSKDSSLRNAWATLSFEQQQSWKQLSFNIPDVSVFGAKGKPTGYLLFLKYNFYPNLFGDALTLEAPAAFQTESISGYILSASAIPLVFAATNLSGPATPRYQFISIRLAWRGQQKSSLDSWKMLGFVKSDQTLINLTAEWIALLGPLRSGQSYESKATIQRPGFFPSSTSIWFDKV